MTDVYDAIDPDKLLCFYRRTAAIIPSPDMDVVPRSSVEEYNAPALGAAKNPVSWYRSPVQS